LRKKLQERLESAYWQGLLGRQVGLIAKRAGAQVVHQQWLINPPLEATIWRAMRKAIRRSVPLIYTAHEVFPHEPALGEVGDQQLYRALYREPERLIVHGETLRRQAIEDAGVAPERVQVVRHGNAHALADAVGAPSAAEARRSLGLDRGDRVILFFGFVRQYKGLDVLLLALERLRRRPGMERAVLLLAGFLHRTERAAPRSWEGSYYGGLARSLRLDSALRVATDYIPIEEVGRYFAAADVICLPYRGGSQSGVIQLAYAFARPVVVTRVGSLAEAVDDGRSGLLVPPEDPEALADALEQLLADRAAAEAMGREARVWSGERFTWRTIAQETLQLYAEAARSCRPGLARQAKQTPDVTDPHPGPTAEGEVVGVVTPVE
jgi:glycosyltransferase involved in cell wall biosynthesis